MSHDVEQDISKLRGISKFPFREMIGKYFHDRLPCRFPASQCRRTAATIALRLSNGELLNHDRFAFFYVSIDHNKLFDILWQSGVRHQVAVTALCLTMQQLGRQHIDLFDHRRLSKELRSFRRQRLSDAAGEMRLTARLVRESVENAKRRWPETDRKPCRGCRSPSTIDKPARRKLSTSASLPGFAFRRTSSATATISNPPSIKKLSIEST